MVIKEPRHKIMDKTLPAILDELEDAIARVKQAAVDAEGHANAAKMSAVNAQNALSDALKPILAQVERSNADAKRALEVGGINSNSITDLSRGIEGLAAGVKRVSDEVRELGLAVVNGLKGYSEYIIEHVSFLQPKK